MHADQLNFMTSHVQNVLMPFLVETVVQRPFTPASFSHSVRRTKMIDQIWPLLLPTQTRMLMRAPSSAALTDSWITKIPQIRKINSMEGPNPKAPQPRYNSAHSNFCHTQTNSSAVLLKCLLKEETDKKSIIICNKKIYIKFGSLAK